MEAPLIIFLVLLLLVGPILGIIAFVGMRRLDEALRRQNPQELTGRIYALEQRLLKLERSAVAAPAPLAPAQSEPIPPAPLPVHAPAPPPPTPVAQSTMPSKPQGQAPLAQPSLTGFAPPPLHTSLPRDSDSADLETVIAGRWFNRIGIVALLVAVSYFLKLAFDNNWIGPSGRVMIGILLGAAMMPWSSWLLGRGYSYFSEGIVALGEATLFVSVWAGCSYYTLYSRDVGFFGMILISSAMAAIALGRDSQRIAVLCLIGGYLTPILVSTGRDQQVVLFTYLLVLGAGMLVMGERKDWYSLAPISFVATEIYYWGWYNEFFHRSTTQPLERTVLFATLFFLLFAALPALRAVKEGALTEIDILLTTVNAFAYVGALYVLFWPDDRWPFTLLILALAAGHIAIARVVPDAKENASPLARYLFAGMGLTFATMAIPIRLNGKWITFCFAAEGAVLIWSGFRAASGFLRQFGYLLLAIAAIRVLLFPPPAGVFLFNQRFAAYLLVIICFGIALWSARDQLDDTGEQEKNQLGIFSVLINVFALIALSLEFWDFFGKTATGIDADLARHLSLSVLWTVYATVLILIGVQQKAALLRWQALALFGLVVVKVFLYDLASLDRAYRILSFLVLGSVLMVVSFLYTKRAAKGRHT